MASALTRLIAAGMLEDAHLDEAWDAIAAVPVKLHALEDGPAAVRLAGRLRRHSAYDAAYVALAVALDAELWTLDGPLARSAAATDLPVRVIAAP